MKPPLGRLLSASAGLPHYGEPAPDCVRRISVGLDFDIKMVSQHGDRVGVLRVDAQITIDDIAGGLEKTLGIAAVPIRLERGVEVDRTRDRTVHDAAGGGDHGSPLQKR